MNLHGKKFFVTGGSRGIGASIVKYLAAQGAQIGFSYQSNEASAKEVLKTLPGDGHFCVHLSLTDESSIEAAVKKCEDTWGHVDGVVNNAGLTKDTLLLRMKAEDFSSVIDANLKGSFMVTKAFLKGMLKNKSGSIVFLTSVIGQTGNAGQANYAASKAGLEAFARSVALEVASRGIRLNCVAPGFIETEMTGVLTDLQKQSILTKIPMGRIAQSEEVAYAVSFLLSDLTTYMTGQTLNVNGGMFMK